LRCGGRDQARYGEKWVKARVQQMVWTVSLKKLQGGKGTLGVAPLHDHVAEEAQKLAGLECTYHNFG
jgi:hypothetical protein